MRVGLLSTDLCLVQPLWRFIIKEYQNDVCPYQPLLQRKLSILFERPLSSIAAVRKFDDYNYIKHWDKKQSVSTKNVNAGSGDL